MRKQIIFLIVCVSVVIGGCGGAGYKSFTLEPLPDWTNKYADSDQGDRSYFKMALLMKDFNLSRLQAVELQNHFRDLTADGMSSGKAFQTALQRVKDFRFESRLKPEALKKAPFIVAVDVDETLLQQYYSMWTKGDQYYDYKIDFGRSGDKDDIRGISMAPEWPVLFKAVKKMGGMVVIYSANVDETIWKIARTVTIDGKKLFELVDGIMTNNYLVLQGKKVLPTQKRASTPVTTPSKDLRILDESLDKVILIDDNPTRVMQRNRLRLPKKYEADLYYSARDEKRNPEMKKVVTAYGKQLLVVLKEIEESQAYAEKEKIPFAKAYLPYTQLGQVTVKWLMETRVCNYSEAVAFIRHTLKIKDIVDESF